MGLGALAFNVYPSVFVISHVNNYKEPVTFKMLAKTRTRNRITMFFFFGVVDLESIKATEI